jgi:hypothetical protein
MSLVNNSRYLTLAALVVTLAAGCSTTPDEAGEVVSTSSQAVTESAEQVASTTTATLSSADADKALAEARIARGQAAASGASLTVSDRMLLDAEAAYASGNYAEAQRLANESYRIAMLARDNQLEQERALLAAREKEALRGCPGRRCRPCSCAAI